MSDGPSLRVEQSNINTGGGDAVGGNKTSISFVSENNGANQQLECLYRRLTDEMKNGAKVEGIVSVLEEFVATQADEVVGLLQKLKDGGMEVHNNYALDAKEKYVKNLARFQLYEAGQAIHGILLSKIQSKYQASVAPRLSSIDPASKLELMQNAVLEPLKRALGDNPLWLQDKELDGMVFFLTGKCKITWT